MTQGAPTYRYVAIEGLIGAGKTTLARRLCEQYRGRLVLEEFDDNPFLPQFYQHPERYAFSVELSFLAQRYHQLKRVTEQELFSPISIADYSIGKSLVFASVTLPNDELALFRDLYRIMYADLPRPDLIVYLHLDQERIRERIAQRGRDYEQGITDAYLNDLQARYLDHLSKETRSRVVVLDLKEVDLLYDGTAFSLVQRLINADHPIGMTVHDISSMIDREEKTGQGHPSAL